MPDSIRSLSRGAGSNVRDDTWFGETDNHIKAGGIINQVFTHICGRVHQPAIVIGNDERIPVHQVDLVDSCNQKRDGYPQKGDLMNSAKIIFKFLSGIRWLNQRYFELVVVRKSNLVLFAIESETAQIKTTHPKVRLHSSITIGLGFVRWHSDKQWSHPLSGECDA